MSKHILQHPLRKLQLSRSTTRDLDAVIWATRENFAFPEIDLGYEVDKLFSTTLQHIATDPCGLKDTSKFVRRLVNKWRKPHFVIFILFHTLVYKAFTPILNRFGFVPTLKPLPDNIAVARSMPYTYIF